MRNVGSLLKKLEKSIFNGNRCRKSRGIPTAVKRI